MKIYKALLSFLAGILLLAVLTPVSAAQIVDLSRSPSLTIAYERNNILLNGAQVGLYYVADVDAYGNFSLSGDFCDYPVVVNGLNEEGFRKLAYTLEGYILRDRLQPIIMKQTNTDGTVTFDRELDGLKLGLYLVQLEQHEQEGYSFEANAFMIALPSVDENTNEQMYHMTARPKTRACPAAARPEGRVSYKVQKVWDDAGHAEDRPETLTIQLLQDGAVYDTVTLDSSNHWEYAWDDLDSGSNWTVVEVEEPHYTVTVIRSGNTFVITNSYSEDGEQPDTLPTDGDTGTDVTAPTEDVPKLPYTGQLWWPVPVLLAVGLALVAIGLVRRRRSDDEK